MAWLAVAVLPVQAQPKPKVYRIGYIQVATPQEQEHLTRAFDAGLRELGYEQGRNVILEQRLGWGKQERMPELATELARLGVDVIVTGANPAIAAVKQATTTIPVVMAASRDPVGSGFVASLAKPGGNITGLTNDADPEIQAKSVELLKTLVPRAARFGLLWNPVPPGAEIYRRVVERAAGKLGVALYTVEVRGRDQFEAAFAGIARARVDGLLVLPDPIFFTARAQVVRLATQHRMPAVFHAREFVELGGLVSYGSNLSAQFRRAAVYVDKILKGSKPGELPIEQPAQFELAINARTAQALGLAIPPALRLRADHLIE